jgi:tRNA pseudouridine38-40 synthase
VNDHLAFRTSYHGAHFAGSQSQRHGLTVQDHFEKALRVFFKKACRVDFTSRTDSGVHARDQIFFLRGGRAEFDTLSPAQQARFQFALNSLLGPSVSIWKMGFLKAGFNPKLHVASKEYRYRLFCSKLRDPLIDDQCWWVRTPLKENQLREALCLFEGEHDFRSVAKASSVRDRKSTKRRVNRIRCLKIKHKRWAEAHFFEICIKGEGFLHQMVRRMVGSSVDFASGRPIDIQELLTMHNVALSSGRSHHVAPASGLCLHQTFLKPGWFKPF